MSLRGDKGVAQFKKSVKMGHPNLYVHLDAKNATTVMADKYMTQRGFSDHIGFVSVYDTGGFFSNKKVPFL